MDKIIGIQFQKNGKLYYFDANGFEPKTGEYVIADTTRGLDLGEVVMPARECTSEQSNVNLRKIIRLASEQDIRHSIENRQKEMEAYDICHKKIAEHKLEMKLVSVEYAFDNSKILFYFTANGRVDFRSLVKDLASVFKMRIELRQIGVRDEAKMLGGLGPCGRPICCGTFLEEFQPVSIKMAKEQNLSLNPTKISGVCGRLMCCLKYEQDHYEMTRKKMPRVGKEIRTPDGTGYVTDLNVLKETVFVKLVNGDTSEIKEYPLEDLTNEAEKKPTEQPPARKPFVPQSELTEEIAPGKEPDEKTNQGQKSDKKNVGLKEKKAEKKTPDAGKGKSVSSRSVLGQPVKRENPNRNNKTPNENVHASAKEEKNISSEEIRPEKTSGKWAEALEQAMRAIDK